MKIINETIKLQTKGNPDLVNITDEVEQMLASSKMQKGMLTVFVVGSTAGVTTFEYEPGLIQDVQDFYEKIIPQKHHYHHDDTWGDANGFSHLRASLQGPSLSVPFDNGKLVLGTWQQIVLAEFDRRPRQRQVVVQIMGE